MTPPFSVGTVEGYHGAYLTNVTLSDAKGEVAQIKTYPLLTIIVDNYIQYLMLESKKTSPHFSRHTFNGFAYLRRACPVTLRCSLAHTSSTFMSKIVDSWDIYYLSADDYYRYHCGFDKAFNDKAPLRKATAEEVDWFFKMSA